MLNENRYATRCDECNDSVKAHEGILQKDKDGCYYTLCVHCYNAINALKKQGKPREPRD